MNELSINRILWVPSLEITIMFFASKAHLSTHFYYFCSKKTVLGFKKTVYLGQIKYKIIKNIYCNVNRYNMICLLSVNKTFGNKLCLYDFVYSSLNFSFCKESRTPYYTILVIRPGYLSVVEDISLYFLPENF